MPYSLTLKARGAEKSQELRKAGQIPGVIYGPDREPTSVCIASNEFVKLYNEAGESSLIDVVVEGQSGVVKALIQDVQYDPVKSTIIHFDLRQINMNEEMHAAIDLVFVGESAAVKEGGTLMKTQDTLEITCLPKDLVSEVTVDLSVLKTFDDAIYVKDIALPAGITTREDGDALIAKVSVPLSEDELKAMEEASTTTIDDIEVEKKGKKEEEGVVGDASEKK